MLGGGGAAKKLPPKPSKDDIMGAMRRVNSAMCATRDRSISGTVKVRITAVSSGAITGAQVENAPFKTSPVGACLEREVKKQRFPAFSESSISFSFPFKI